MKLKISGLLLLITFTLAGAAQEELFLQAQAAYGKKEYARAFELFTTMHHKSHAVWYNMGNCAFQLKRYNEAYLFWRRAERAATAAQRADIAYNLDAIAKVVAIDLTKKWYDPLLRAATMISMIIWQIAFLCCWLLLCFCVAQRKKRAVAMIALWGTMVSGLGLRINYVQNSQSIGIVTADSVALYSGPDERYHSVGALKKMDELQIQEMRESWCKVRHRTGQGWMKKDALEVV